MNESSDVEKFKSFLKEIFRIDLQDLDFGIYKIMNIKKDMIQKFIDDDLIRIADSVISEFPDKDQNLMTDVFNLSYEFLSRYYSNGDFIPQIRYGGRDKYMIPYNGQEVELYWATRNSYYVKTTEYFTNYSFIVYDPFNPDDKYKINFKIREADLDKNYVASEKKYFFIAEDPIFIHDNDVDIFFNYRPLRDDESEVFQGNEKTKRDIVRQKAEETILNKVPNNLREILSRKTMENDTDRSIIRRHIDIYFKRNESDYFIVKNLRKFLDSELDNFVKNEILLFDADFKMPENNRILAKAVSELCKLIIEQISQSEDFEKRLWEKKKFAYNVNYVVTLDRIANKENGIEIIKKLINHTGMKNQIEEWDNLGLIGTEFNMKRIIQESLDGQILNNDYKFLAVDTKYFKEIENDILSSFENLDDDLDGWLLHSENFQALNTIAFRFKEKIRTIYIDPPYNTGNDGFIYRDSFKHSSWLSMMDNRVGLAKYIANPEGVIFVSIGDLDPQEGESYRLQLLLSTIFNKRFGNLIWKKRGGIGSFSEKYLTENHEYIAVYGNEKSFLFDNIISEQKKKQYTEKDEKGPYRWMDLIGPSQQTKEKRPNLNYGILCDVKSAKMIGFEYYEKGEKKVEFFDNEYTSDLYTIRLEGKYTWLISKQYMKKYYREGLVRVFEKNGSFGVKIKNYLYNDNGSINGNILKSLLSDNGVEIGMNQEATKELAKLFSDLDTYTINPKPVSLIKLLIYASCPENGIVLDFFSGSGTTAHAVMKLNKEDGGKRKFILIEMADYLQTIILPRLKKIAYSFEWKDGKPLDNEGIGLFLKYYDLEQYEDSLNNIKVREQQNYDKFKPYLVEYILKYGTSDSAFFINKEMLSDPFNVKMKIVNGGIEKEATMDLIETFNLWYGVNVEKVVSIDDRDRRYVFIKGRKDRQRLIIIWRNTRDLDFIAEKDFIMEKLRKDFNIEDDSQGSTQVLFNNDCALDLSVNNIEVKSLDPIFFELQWDGLSDE